MHSNAKHLLVVLSATIAPPVSAFAHRKHPRLAQLLWIGGWLCLAALFIAMLVHGEIVNGDL